MELEIERRRGRYFVFVREGDRRWEVLPPGELAAAERGGWRRNQAFSAALLAGFTKRQVERAFRRTEPPRR